MQFNTIVNTLFSLQYLPQSLQVKKQEHTNTKLAIRLRILSTCIFIDSHVCEVDNLFICPNPNQTYSGVAMWLYAIKAFNKSSP